MGVTFPFMGALVSHVGRGSSIHALGLGKGTGRRMSWSIWQTLWARAEPPAAARADLAPSPSLKVLLEIFRPASAHQEDPSDAEVCVSEQKEAQVP